MLSERQQKVLAVLRDHPEMAVDALAFRAMPGVPRREALNTLHRLVDQGWIMLTGKRSRTEIAGAMVTLCAVPVALDQRRGRGDGRRLTAATFLAG